MTTGSVVRRFVPLRPSPQEEDPFDKQRIEMVRGYYFDDQDDALAPRDRQVEENIRMLCGQQYHVWSPVFGRYIDAARLMAAREREWQQMPVLDRLLKWYMLTHARITENPPIVSFVPGPDNLDAQLAETMDTIFKTKWREAGLIDVWDTVAGWLIVAGRAGAITRIVLDRGAPQPWSGFAEIPLLGLDGQPVMGQDQQPMTVGVEGPMMRGEGGDLAPMMQAMQREGGEGYDLAPQEGAQPYAPPEGDIEVQALSPFEFRGEWGPTPWHQKRWHSARFYLSPEAAYELTGEEIAPDITHDESVSTGIAQRVLFGSGWFGSADGGGLLSGERPAFKEGLVEITCAWAAPCSRPGMEQTPDSPGGRFAMVTRAKVLRDGPRPVAYPYVSPIQCWDFLRIPGRPSGSTPQEVLNGPQRQYNTGYRRLGNHAAMLTNPTALIDNESGIKQGQWTNKPGQGVLLRRRPGVAAVEYVSPPPIGPDAWRLMEFLRDHMEDIGNLLGTEGDSPTEGASGELVKELRFNSDRFVGPTLRRAAEEFARMMETWIAVLPVVWTREKILRYAGDDNIARTMTVLPEMFTEGKVNVIPDIESMLPEGRGERQARVHQAWVEGVFGPPESPEARMQYLSLGRFAHLSRLAKPGGVHRTMAEQENGRLMRGEPAATIPIYEWQDHLVHLMVIEDFMSGPEFEKQDPFVQAQFVEHRLRHIFFVQQQQAMALQAQAAEQQAMAPAEGGGNGKPGGKGKGAKDQPSEGRPMPPESAAEHRTGDEPAGRYPTQAGSA